MKSKFHLILALACLLCFSSTSFAQDVDQPEKPKATKKAKRRKGKQPPLAKHFGGAELTDAQKTQLTELVSAKKDEMLAIRKNLSELVTKEDAKQIRLSIRRSVRSGMEQPAAQKAAWTEVGVSVEDQTKIAQSQKQLEEIEQGIVNQIVATFSEEQKETMKAGKEKAAMKAGNKGKAKKGKGKKAKKKPEQMEEEN